MAQRKRKSHTGYEKVIEGFVVDHLFVHRNSNGLYDVYVHFINGPKSELFDFSFVGKEKRASQYQIFADIPTRKAATKLARDTRERLFRRFVEHIAELNEAVRALREL